MNAEDKAEYGRFFLAELQRELDSRWCGESRRRVRIEEVKLGPFGPSPQAVVLLRDRTRPECLFGWRSIADPETFARPDVHRSLRDAAETDAKVAAVNLEDVLTTGLPRDCSPGIISWF